MRIPRTVLLVATPAIVVAGFVVGLALDRYLERLERRRAER